MTASTMFQPLLAREIRATAQGLLVVLPDRDVLMPWSECSPRLAAASDSQRAEAHLSPSGYGIHWPLIDEDLAVGPLVAGCG